MQDEVILAVDFGTSNSLVGAIRNGQRIEALPLDPFASDPTLMRTLLYFADQDHCYYGEHAIQKFLENEMEGRLFRSFKSHLPNKNYLGTYIDDRVLTLESLIGVFMLELKKRAEEHLQMPISRAVVGRPARYSLDPTADNFALHRMTKACEFARFKQIEFIPEPLAAAFDYRRQLQEEKVVLIGDFGGGTSDFTLIRIGPYAYKKEHVLGISGCPLAGDALDSLFMSQRLNEYFGGKAKYRVSLGRNILTMPISITERLFKPAHIVHLKEAETYDFIQQVKKGALSEQDRQAVDRLFVLIEDQQIFSVFEGIEKTKRSLSKKDEAEFVFDYPKLEIKTLFKQKEFEGWAGEVKNHIFSALDECLAQAQLSPEQIDMVCLTGGSAQVPLLRQEFVNRFGTHKLQTQTHFHSVLSGLIEGAKFIAEGTM